MADVIDAVFDAIADAAPEVRAGLPDHRATRDDQNASGDTQLEADVWADDLLFDRTESIEGVNWYASEERDAVVTVGDAEGGYAVALDPLDGSSNVKSNNPCGTVVGIYDQPLPAPGSSLVAAGFVLYGPTTTMVVARDDTVRESLVSETGATTDLGPVELPAEPTVYGFGGRVPDWTPAFESFVRDVEDDLKLRYGGAMIADVNQVLVYGGVFGYPGLESAPDGKLRAQFEALPIAYIVETAGGASSDGTQSLLDVAPTRLHERTPTFVGTDDVIAALDAALPDHTN
ncbi:class 1 fructose-1,6-bisphosphatase [Halobacterium salinarum]|uniref:class 1 fructose-bisphosphatase n=1 Tax=Halobacterium TaxID=2239 RepID=UPI001963FF18|nr:MULTISPECIES: class 1 fructose-1,6-bisphosphatase [Halobacterium]MDL0138579.1 class 1 fructose-1,6-bisphosphatase [Halobacterium salinarum]QRY23224.1 class 1 fructose-1,6-bisphosphatase [Halobacterium sp. GSL-19]WJK64482.1 class 1 fructose-1,6-bisphosphatase [Halobacterium salinarum]